MVGKLNGFHHALPTLDCSKFYFVARQGHTWNGHSGLETEVNGWPSKHLEQTEKLQLPCGLGLGKKNHNKIVSQAGHVAWR